MAVPAIPQNFFVQTGNQQDFLSWDITTGATSYDVQRSTDGVSYVTIATPAVNSYLDTAVTLGTQYYYKVAAVNGSGTGSYTVPQSVVPTLPGEMSLGEMRLRAQQRADRVNSQFVTMPEWNFFINQSYYELYDILITLYEDYYVAPKLQITTDGSQSYDLPNGQNYNGAPALYKLYGVDCGLAANTNAWVTLKKFDFIQRNRYVFPQLTTTLLGVFNLQYRVIGNKIMFVPTPSAAQYIGLWYFPRLTTLLKDTDVMDGISGWTQYPIIRAAKYALDKEESDTSHLDAELMYLKQRIEESAMNRDAGQPDTISPTRTWSERWGGSPNGDGSSGGW
jgi:hypothetical protein